MKRIAFCLSLLLALLLSGCSCQSKARKSVEALEDLNKEIRKDSIGLSSQEWERELEIYFKAVNDFSECKVSTTELRGFQESISDFLSNLKERKDIDFEKFLEACRTVKKSDLEKFSRSLDIIKKKYEKEKLVRLEEIKQTDSQIDKIFGL